MPSRKPVPAPDRKQSLTRKSFAKPQDLRAWFARHAGRDRELWIRFFKVGSGRPSVTYPEALDEALAVGWIDGVRKRLDEESYLQRFSPRKPRSYWSAVNIRKAEALIAAGCMTPAGLAAFNGRHASEAKRYSYENRPRDLPPPARAALEANPAARAYWEKQPPGYRRLAAWYVMSAKLEATRARRLAALIGRLAKRQRPLQAASSAPAGGGRKKGR